VLTRLLALALLLSPTTLPAQDSGPSSFLSAYAKKQSASVNGDLATFTRLTQPYAPLDIQVVGAAVSQARQIKVSFFDLAASASGIAHDKSAAMTNDFHCQGCGPARVEGLWKDVPAIRLLVQRFNDMPNELTLLAQWGIPGDFRFNSIFHEGSLTQEYASNQNIFPGAAGRTFQDVSTPLVSLGIHQSDLETLLNQMDALHIVALVRTPEGTRAIRAGVTCNEAGLLFVYRTGDIPKPRAEDNGILINDFIAMSDDVFYFES
jgi:hypothetical protein